MRYIPKLIPKEHKVLPDYFKEGGSRFASNKNKFIYGVSVAGAILFFLSALAFIDHPLPAILFGLLGLLLLPVGHRLIERKLKFRLTTGIKTVFAVVFFVIAAPLAGHYQAIDQKESHLLRERKEKAEGERIAKEKAEQQKEQQRRDSLDYYLHAAAELENASKHESALRMLSYAAAFAPGGIETSEIVQGRNRIVLQQTASLIKNGAYAKAIPQLSAFIETEPTNSNLLYQRALCYSKTGKTKEAVEDLKTAMEHGSEEAEKLHEKINPIRKKIVGYTTLCCDGTTSSARGRGACSWHGGVCNWNEPVYEEYRKY
jgi:tetratricopeptide (TPR) repeat protein